MSKRTANVLRKARKLLAEKGWLRGRYGEGPFCAVGAIRRACNMKDPSVDTEGNRRAYAAAIALGYAVDEGVIPWNDAPGRTKRQVLAAFDRAIKAEERT